MRKRCGQYIFLIIALPFCLWWRAASLVIGRDRAFLGMSQCLSLFPGLCGCLLRGAFYRLALKNTSQDIVVEFLSTFSHPDARLGAHVTIGSHCNIGLAHIGKDSLVGSRVSITSGRRQHGLAADGAPMRLQEGLKERVSIGPDCWIGNGAVIMADVGRGAVVAAGGIVVHPVEDFAIAAGNPARIVGSRLETTPEESDTLKRSRSQEKDKTPGKEEDEA